MFSKSFLLGLVFGLIALYIIVALYESKGTRELIRQLCSQWCKRNLFEKLSVFAVIAMLTIYAGTKPAGTGYEPSSYVVSLPDVGLVQEGSALLSGGISIEDAPMSSENPELTYAQMINGYALTQVSTGTVSWLRYPDNYTVISNWLAYGVHDDVQHLKVDPQFPIYYSTNTAADLWVSSSGTLSFDAVKGSPFISTNGLPDGSLIPYAAVLHGPLSIIPPESRVWYAASATNYYMTWENLYAGRQTSNPVTFQMEVLANQDIIYRYLLGSNTVNAQTLTNFLVGLQANTPEGGESLRFSSTNSTPEIFELYWTYFSYLDPAISDHDGDGLSSALEVLVYNTNPHMVDTDLDGLSDADEIRLGTDPNNRDTDGDGIPDGSDPFPLTYSKLDLDHDGLDDAWEIYWFGSTNVTDSGANDSNGNGRSDLADLLSGNNAAFSAYAVTTTHGANLFSCTALPGATNYSFYAVGDGGTLTNVIAAATNVCSILVTGCGFTNGVYALYAAVDVDSTNKVFHITGPVIFEQPVQPNRTVYSITPACALQSPSEGMTVIERTFAVNRTRAYNQYYIASDVNADPDDVVGDWALEGLTLEWSDSTGGAGVTNASPINDTLWLGTGADAVTVTVALRTTGSNQLARCTRPLYLIEWTPTVTIDTNATLIATEEGNVMVLVSNQQDDSTELSFSVNTKGYPSRAALTAGQQAALNDPFGDGGDSFNLQTDASGLIIGGSFISGTSGALSLTPPGGEPVAGAAGGEGGAGQGNPGTAGQGPLTLYRISPMITYYSSGSSSNNFCECGNAYPFDNACLRKQWLYSYYPTNAYSEGGNEGVEVTLGLSAEEAEKFDIFINNEKGALYNWKDGDTAAHATVTLSADALWHSTLVRIDMTDRGTEYWGDGPATSVTAEEDRCGCDDGCADGDCSGNDGPDLGSLKFRLSLGQSGFEQSGGFIWFKCETLPVAITPELFNATALPAVNIISNATAITQVDNPAVNGRRIDVSTLSAPDGVKLTIYRYDSEQNAKLEGSWEITRSGAALSFVGKDANNNIRRHLTYSYDVDIWIDSGACADRRWRETDNLTGKVRDLFERDSGQSSKKTRLETKDIDGNIHYGIQQEYTTIGSGTAAVERVESRSVYGEYGDGWYTTTYYYHVNNLNPQVNGKIKVQNNPDCSWEYYLWDNSGRETLSVISMDGCVAPTYLNEWAPSFNFNPSGSYLDLNAKITQYSYTPHAGDLGNWRDAAQPRTVAAYRVSNGTPVLTARTWHKYQRGTTNVLGATCSIITHTAIRAASQNSTITDPANRTSVDIAFIETYSGSRYLDGRPLYHKSEDGSTTCWEYELGTYGADERDALIVVEYTGTESNPDGIADRSTYEAEVRDLYYGHTLSRQTFLYRGAQEDILLSYEDNSYDDKGRLTSTEYSDGTSRFNLWSCCRLLESIARDGSATEYWEIPGTPLESESYNSSLGALPGANGLFPVNGSVIDLMGRTTNSYQAVGNGAAHSTDYAKQVTTTEYPQYASHFRVTTDLLGVVTTNRISINYSGRPCIITDETIRAGVTTTSARLDNGEPETTIEWTDSVSGEQLKKMTKTESEIQPNGWKKRTSYVKYDDGEWLTHAETTYDFLGRVIATVTPLGITSNFFDSETGRLTKVSRTGSADTIYVYNELGEQIVSSLDVNGNNVVDYAGLDRVNRVNMIYELRSNDWWQVTYNMVWAETNSATCITSSISRVRMTGLGADTYNGGVLTAQNESEDWHGNITRSSTYIDAANATTWQVTDTPTSTLDDVQKFSAGYSVQTISITSITNTYTYDGFARQITATDGRTSTTCTAYNDLGQVAYIEDAATNRSSFAYNNLGQRTMVSNALGQVSHTAYNPQGQTIATWGTTYPVAYQFDTTGRLIAMATTRSNAYENVNLNTFVSLGDALNDCNVQGLDITQWQYDEATGLLTNKLYADGNGTSYTYTETGKIQTRTLARGKTTTYVYNNLGQLTDIDYSDSTPDVTFTHDRLGRIISASSSTSARTFHYDGLTLDYETQDGDIIDRKQDSFGRTIGYILTGGPSPPMTLTYSFDEYGRLSSVTSIIGAETNTFTYTYLQGTDLVNAMSSDSGVQWSRYYESERNLIVAVSNSWDSTVISSFDYINDPLVRRTRRADYYNGSTLINDFDYNIRGEIISAIMSNDNHSYSNDPIGNRKQSTVCSGQSTVTNTYTANNLNQYTSASFAGSARNLSHDLDGNLTWDGIHWSHDWDAENRLISSAPDYWGTTNGATRIDYTYDYMNRRISKTASIMSGRSVSFPPSPLDPQGAWSALETHRYIWDGWNIAAEIIIDQTIFATNVNYYTWGLDLSGTLQGAGGIGGLLSDTKITATDISTYYALSDANGNVTEYMDSTGAVKAHYEYSAFGEITAQAGPLTGDFTHRFSTKYFDKITGLYYYGHRYYDLVLMRWLSKDPIEEEGGLNLYCAMCNNAISFVDPFGLEIKGPDSIVVYSTNYDSRRNRLEYASDNKVCEWELTGNIKKYKSNSKSIYINPTSLSTAVDDSTLTAVYKDGSKDRKLITVIRPKYLTRWSADPLLAHAWQPRFHMVVTIYDQFDRHFPAGVYVTEKIGHTSSGFIRVYTLLGSAYTNLKGQIGDDFGAQLHRKKNAYLNIYQTIHIGEWKAVVVSQLLYKDALPDSDNFFGTPVIKFNGVKKANFHNY